MSEPRDITVLIAARNEAVNLPKCLGSLKPVRRVLVIDLDSTDGSDRIARELGAEVVSFDWNGRYPRKRQWALDYLEIDTAWVMLSGGEPWAKYAAEARANAAHYRWDQCSPSLAAVFAELTLSAPGAGVTGLTLT
ncbi:MAG: glycosyltransferase [Kiritimatiellia bacterium]